MEKELTYEATIDSLKEMAIKFSKDTYVNRVLVNAINLIHRLQDKVNEWEQKLEDGELVSKDWHDEQVLHLEEQCQLFLYDFEQQKAEIERLAKVEMDLIGKIADQKAEIERMTKEHERIAWSKQEYLEWVDGFLRTHTDMKDRGEDYKMFDREWLCGVFWAKIEGSLDYIIDLEKQRNELQKQVDELKDELEKAYITERANIQAEIAEAGTSCHWCEQQTVKDTAKEIFQKLYSIRDKDQVIRIEMHNLQELCDGYGVEVE